MKRNPNGFTRAAMNTRRPTLEGRLDVATQQRNPTPATTLARAVPYLDKASFMIRGDDHRSSAYQLREVLAQCGARIMSHRPTEMRYGYRKHGILWLQDAAVVPVGMARVPGEALRSVIVPLLISVGARITKLELAVEVQGIDAREAERTFRPILCLPMRTRTSVLIDKASAVTYTRARRSRRNLVMYSDKRSKLLRGRENVFKFEVRLGIEQLRKWGLLMPQALMKLTTPRGIMLLLQEAIVLADVDLEKLGKEALEPSSARRSRGSRMPNLGPALRHALRDQTRRAGKIMLNRLVELHDPRHRQSLSGAGMRAQVVHVALGGRAFREAFLKVREFDLDTLVRGSGTRG